MNFQIIIVILFLLNLAIAWLAYFAKKAQLYRFVGIFVFIVLPFITVFLGQPRFVLDYFWWRIAGILAMVLGFGVVLWATQALKDISLLISGSSQKLVTSGPYRYVRHPFYLGLIFMFVGWWWIFAAVYSFYFGMFILALIWIQAYLEEKLILEKQYGMLFKEYRRNTGMFWIK
jgi:protein-S-isoprenylcysteine O-methyltransferase Ste14